MGLAPHEGAIHDIDRGTPLISPAVTTKAEPQKQLHDENPITTAMHAGAGIGQPAQQEKQTLHVKRWARWGLDHEEECFPQQLCTAVVHIAKAGWTALHSPAAHKSCVPRPRQPWAAPVPDRQPPQPATRNPHPVCACTAPPTPGGTRGTAPPDGPRRLLLGCAGPPARIM